MKDTSIFILDDDVYYGRCMQKSLQKAFCNVKHFKTERNFVKALDLNPTIVILDHFLEKQVGLNMIDEIKKRGLNPHLLYVSSQDQVHITLEAYSKGVLAYFEKKATTYQDVLSTLKWMSRITKNFSESLDESDFRQKLLKKLG